MARALRGVLGSLAALGIASWACSSFEDAAPVNDADAGEGGALDAAADGTPDTIAVAFCKDGGVLCEDFDDPGSAELSLSAIDDGGAIEASSDLHVSPPNALRVTLARPPTGDCHYVLRGTPALDIPAANGFVVESKIRVAALPTRVLAGPSTTYEEPDAGSCSVYLEVRSEGDALVVERLDDSTGAQFIPLSRKLVAGAWAHVAYDVHGAAGARQVTVTIDDQTAAKDVPLMAKCQSGARIIDFSVGLICATVDVGHDLDFAYDDIRVITH